MWLRELSIFSLIHQETRDSKQTMGRLSSLYVSRKYYLVHVRTCRDDDCRRPSTAVRPSTLQVAWMGTDVLRNSDPLPFFHFLSASSPTHTRVEVWPKSVWHANIVWTMTKSKISGGSARELTPSTFVNLWKNFWLWNCYDIVNCDLLIFIVIFLLYKILDISAFVSVWSVSQFDMVQIQKLQTSSLLAWCETLKHAWSI